MAAAKKVWKETTGSVGKNASFTVDAKGIMTLKVDLNLDLGKSASGKTNIISTSAGNQSIDGGNGAIIGLNVYRKPE